MTPGPVRVLAPWHRMPTIRLIEARPLGGRATHFAFEAPFAHEAGQYVALSAEIAGSPVQRYYSIASPPRLDRSIEFCIEPSGDFGRHLSQLQAGDEVACSEPGGRMRLLDPDRPAVYLAAGTGIAPLRAILLAQLQGNPGADATLVLGARSSLDLAYLEEFETLADRHAGLRVWPTVSGEDAAWNGRRGRVTAHLADAVRGRPGVDAYFCGPPDMVAQLRRDLAAAGVPDERQVFERY